MKRILKWLETKFSQHSAAVEADERHTTVRVKTKDTAEEEYSVEVAFDASVPGRVESDKPGKDIQMPNIYDCEDPFKKQQLKTLDQSSRDASESVGVDPYNTGRFDTSKSRSPK
jgi:hypothetical protein